MKMEKTINTIINGYNNYRDSGFNPIIAGILTGLSTLIGIAIGIGITFIPAWCCMFIYNNLANAFHWPIFSIWFWFIGLFAIGSLKGIFVHNKIKKKEIAD